MNATIKTLPTVKSYAHLAAAHWKRWALPTVVVALAAVVYAAVRPDTWKAEQALILRNEATSHEAAPGKFRQPEEMKTLQETALEVIRSHGVLADALAEVGPPADATTMAAWPSEQDIVELRKNVKLAPPKGAEFGKTEVFYLEVRDADRARALALSEAILKRLQTRSQELRDEKAKSMIAELGKTVQVAAADLSESTAKLTAIESSVGGDLGELKGMSEANAGDSALRRTTTEIRSELRDVRTTLTSNAELAGLLKEAQADPSRLIAMPNRLLDSQPSLRRLKEGLVDAQMNTARLQGLRSAEHPIVLAAKHAEEQVAAKLHNELTVAVRAMDVELRLNGQREKLLVEQLDEVTSRLGKLAALRASYTNQLAEANHRKTLLERAEQNLAEARASQASANASTLISAIDAADAGVNPVGPSRAMVVLFGLLGGLATGAGVLLLTVPAPIAPAKARAESWRADRRKSGKSSFDAITAICATAE